ncbi:uncharacterized protein CLUP02_11226 [Colletotrichum lupini]|uniref:Uncharacterized protein n=1 Tax=Colletotrichum lupini TaxID=145971 RepID=A0A9Q8T007_9PEZI|nr:uncharacterized protein CLUP02_11226 [Colletotrichum lupini]UQC85727.1 hypothetical protein CLUP02_11226 [Colletotrichum lupini]
MITIALLRCRNKRMDESKNIRLSHKAYSYAQSAKRAAAVGVASRTGPHRTYITLTANIFFQAGKKPTRTSRTKLQPPQPNAQRRFEFTDLSVFGQSAAPRAKSTLESSVQTKPAYG